MNIKELRRLLDQITDHTDDEKNYIWIASEKFDEKINYEEVYNRLREYIIELKKITEQGEELRKSISIY